MEQQHCKILNLWWLLLLSITALLHESPVMLVVGEPQVPCLFIFGDSLVDNGNNVNRFTSANVKYRPYGIDFPDGPTGRFTNGRNIADIIAELLGFDKFTQPFVNASNEDILGGVNYGSGGAGILDETGRQLGDIISLNDQLSNHEVAMSRLAKLLGSESKAKKHVNKCIFYVGIGNNDYLTNYLPELYSSSTPYTPQDFAQILISQYLAQLQKLYDNGARKVAVFALGSLGCVPYHLAAYGNGSSCVEASNAAVRIFNENLELLLDDLNNRLPDAKFVRVTSEGNSLGSIRILSEPCCSRTFLDTGHCIPGSVACSNRDEYMFWDAVHPTEAANLISAKLAYDSMSPLYAADESPAAAYIDVL